MLNMHDWYGKSYPNRLYVFVLPIVLWKSLSETKWSLRYRCKNYTRYITHRAQFESANVLYIPHLCLNLQSNIPLQFADVFIVMVSIMDIEITVVI